MASDSLSSDNGSVSNGTDNEGESHNIPSTVIDLNAVTTNSLKALQSEDQRKIMDLVDKLRRIGLSGIVELPQIIVVGDQSSGKSSVLEAITEIPFPRKENLCTRFATEIILRRSSKSTISITITPDKLRPKAEQSKLKSFTRSIEDFKQLPDIIEEATEAMGLGAVGGANSRAFSRDVLSVQIEGPDRPQLTLVDLPGLIHSTTKAQTEADKELILNLVKEYMNNERTIILAVVSAKNDYANQVVLEHARKADEKGRRTLGIITKPDFLPEGSDNERDWLELAQNKDVYLERGWHMLKNREHDQMHFAFAQRNESEDLFFRKGRYANLPRDCVGIDSLRQRLSKLLLNHLIKELPTLRREMTDKLQEAINDISKLGEPRATSSEQRLMLTNISGQVQDILKAAIKGNYDNSFFGAINMNASVDAPENIRRFRAVVQHLNLQFADDMRLRGHKYAIREDNSDEVKNEEYEEYEEEIEGTIDGIFLPKPKVLSRKEGVDWVKNIMVRSRGYELPGTFQPLLISQLFWEQSEPWRQIASEHIAKVARACKNFVNVVLQHCAPAEIVPRLLGFSVDDALANSMSSAQEEMDKLVADKNRHPMTYNHYFTTTLQKIRMSKYEKITAKASKSSEEKYHDKFHGLTTLIQPDKLLKSMTAAFEQDMENFSSEEALDNQQAYYKDELKYFVNAICKAVVERHLVEPLSEIVLSPVFVVKMNEDEVNFVAAEPVEITHQRTFLESRKAMLEKGLETFREAMGGLKR